MKNRSFWFPYETHCNEVEQMANPLGLIEKLSTKTYQSDYKNAKATGTCVICKRPAREFRYDVAEFEYSVSALCQHCQDEYLSARG